MGLPYMPTFRVVWGVNGAAYIPVPWSVWVLIIGETTEQTITADVDR